MSVNLLIAHLVERDTPSIRWLRTAVTPAMRAQWAAENAAIAAADRNINGSK